MVKLRNQELEEKQMKLEKLSSNIRRTSMA